MNFPIKGLHHVTATVSDAQEDLDFYTQLLGLRLVKKTVNFDNNAVYHFYYGNEHGTPGTIMTTFPYKGHGVRTGVKGTGQVNVTTFSIPVGSLGFWAKRLNDAKVATREFDRFGVKGIGYEDPSGLLIEMIEGEDSREPWTGNGIREEVAIRGFHSVTMVLAEADPTIQLLTNVLNFEETGREGNRIRLEADDKGVGKIVDLLIEPDRERGKNGIGTVHHVALAVENDEVHQALHRYLIENEHRVTDIKDRNYFHSIYFREPGGVLIEVATIPPGFSVDESTENLGKDLKLPEWEEKQRSVIEKSLPSVSY
ncbi:MAG: ring-cleaving dioxygenase [Bacteroidota bacterium]